ncbi:nitrogen regulatory protein PII-like uncharacterized protein [Flavobacterium sp. 7E]|uniref:hypothetical protein n=1 Tax=Flavobacterium sp. 7E TaxID=2735898 RepID=UPI00156FAAC1|nr:hypothetical protein [Flavobacterium sp. 7E]NRS90919.1 nitrogen regulatory protein PII-like uncharacterized protein [Flavobacterium sp. 7E]
MKKISIFIILFFSTQYLSAQNIVDFFYSIPSEYLDNLSFIERKNLVSNGTLTNEDIIYSLNIDKKNGYLRLEQSYTEGQSGYQIFKIAYWNTKNKKLIAISSIGGSNGGFSQTNFKFFEYKNEILSEIKTGHLKAYSNNFDVFMNNLVSEFCKSNVSQSIKEDLATAQFTIELPKNGKDIKISFEENNMSAQDFFEKNYSKFIKFKEKIYVWDITKEQFE